MAVLFGACMFVCIGRTPYGFLKEEHLIARSFILIVGSPLLIFCFQCRYPALRVIPLCFIYLGRRSKGSHHQHVDTVDR